VRTVFNVILFCGMDAVSVYVTIRMLNPDDRNMNVFTESPVALFSSNEPSPTATILSLLLSHLLRIAGRTNSLVLKYLTTHLHCTYWRRKVANSQIMHPKEVWKKG
jgi:hypothetical protein